MLAKSLFPALFAATLLPASAGIGTEKVASGFERPVWLGQPAGIDGKLWILEQAGKVWIVDAKSGERQGTPFLDIVSDVSRKGNEEGLLGLAFAPDFAKTGRFYVNYTDKEHQTKIVRFTAKGGGFEETDPHTAEVLLQFPQPYENHNGGWISFGPDGMLYTGLGDGGSGNDPKNSGQTLGTFLGKILRIDVSGKTGYTVPKDNPFVNRAGAQAEIWSYGLRNPWRCSFDRKTGDFWIGDVGQNAWEEIDFMPKGKARGANFGWRLREGEIETPGKGVGGPAPKGSIEPVYVYKHGGGPTEGLSVTGGYVHRGPVKELEGRYVFGDYQNPRIWSFKLEGGKVADFKDHTADLQPEGGRIGLIASFGEDNAGNLYIVDHQGPVYRVITK